MIDFAMIMLRAVSITGVVMVLAQHVDMAWWEGGVLTFATMLFFGHKDA